MRNPTGTVHAPFSEQGCVIFVKLRQMAPQERRAVCLRPEGQALHGAATPGLSVALLDAGNGISVSLERLRPGASRPQQDGVGGEEWLVLEGSVREARAGAVILHAWSWVREPDRRRPALHSETGALLWVKRGHLPTPPVGCET